MRLTEVEAVALNDAWRSHGGAILRRMLAEQSELPKDELWAIMANKPDTLTGKTALKYAIRSKALTDFKDSVEDELKALNPVGAGR